MQLEGLSSYFVPNYWGNVSNGQLSLNLARRKKVNGQVCMTDKTVLQRLHGKSVWTQISSRPQRAVKQTFCTRESKQEDQLHIIPKKILKKKTDTLESAELAVRVSVGFSRSTLEGSAINSFNNCFKLFNFKPRKPTHYSFQQ